jgi:hypothetical protein
MANGGWERPERSQKDGVKKIFMIPFFWQGKLLKIEGYGCLRPAGPFRALCAPGGLCARVFARIYFFSLSSLDCNEAESFIFAGISRE